MAKIQIDLSEVRECLLLEDVPEDFGNLGLSLLDRLGLELVVSGTTTAPGTLDHVIRLGLAPAGDLELVAPAVRAL